MRKKRDVLRTVARECGKLEQNRYISMSNSSDPYPPVEKDEGITRNVLKIFREHGFQVLIITKSDIVTRDVDILETMNAVVSITITTIDDEIAKLLEPKAPLPSRRIKALEKLSEKVPCVVRIDPLIPGINENFEEVVEVVAPYAKHCVFSTFKVRKDALARIVSVFPEVKEKLQNLYFKNPVIVGNSYYLPEGIRAQVLQRAKEVCKRHNLAFSSCREMLPQLNDAGCDGSGWLQR